jgi:hypothetical protein
MAGRGDSVVRTGTQGPCHGRPVALKDFALIPSQGQPLESSMQSNNMGQLMF